jgi:hypothetical protein
MHPTTANTTAATAPGHHLHPAAVTAHPSRAHYRRGFIIGLVTSIALVFWLIAMTTPIGMVDYKQDNQGRLSVDAWHTCSKLEDGAVTFCRPLGHADDECATSRDTYRVEQAFLILTGLMLIPLLCCAAVDFSHKLDAHQRVLPFHLGTHGWMLFFAIMTALMSLVAFAVGFAIPRMNPCSNGSLYDAPNFEWGPSPIFSLLTFVCALVDIAVALALRQDGSVKTREEVAHPNEPVVVVHDNEPLARHSHEPLVVHRTDGAPAVQRAEPVQPV